MARLTPQNGFETIYHKIIAYLLGFITLLLGGGVTGVVAIYGEVKELSVVNSAQTAQITSNSDRISRLESQSDRRRPKPSDIFYMPKAIIKPDQRVFRKRSWI